MRYTEYNFELGRFVVPCLYKADGGQITFKCLTLKHLILICIRHNISNSSQNQQFCIKRLALCVIENL